MELSHDHTAFLLLCFWTVIVCVRRDCEWGDVTDWPCFRIGFDSEGVGCELYGLGSIWIIIAWR